LTAVVADLRVNGRTSADHTQQRIDDHVLTYFNGDRRLASVTTRHLTAYSVHRLDAGAARATINQELAIIRRAFRLALRNKEIVAMPYVGLLTLDNTRKGFLEREQFDATSATCRATCTRR
jgi:integrase